VSCVPEAQKMMKKKKKIKIFRLANPLFSNKFFWGLEIWQFEQIKHRFVK